MLFQLKHYKMEVFEIIFLLLFHPKISFLQHTKMFNLDYIKNGNNEDHNKIGHIFQIIHLEC